MTALPPPRKSDDLDMLTIFIAILTIVGIVWGLSLEPIQ